MKNSTLTFAMARKQTTIFLGCIFFIAEQAAAQTLTVTITATNATNCTAPCNGSLTATPTNGTPPYTYVWGTSPAQQTQTATGVCPGTWQYYVADATGNQAGGFGTVTCSGAGVYDYELNAFLDIYPNPSSGMFNVQWLMANGNTSTINHQPLAIEIYNVMGEMVLDLPVNQLTNQLINLSSHPDGIYFLQLKTEHGTATKKLIISK